jgi:signal transduction histidine kinase/CheY-like chemotaxis protein/HAMP domain-containing protein
MKIKNLKIRTRLLVGFGAILSFVILLGGIAFWHSGMIWNNTEYLYQHPFKVNMAIREIQTNVMAMQRSMKNVVLSENQEEFNDAVHNINLNEAEAYQWFDTIYALYLGKKSTIDTAYNALRDWKPVREETIRLMQAGRNKEAIGRSKTIGEHHVALLMSKLHLLRDFSLNKSRTFYNSAQESRNQLYIRLWVVLIIIIVLSFAIIYFILAGITDPLRNLVASVEHYANGRYYIRSEQNSTNELGVLAASMNKLAEKVQFDLNVKNGILEIADVMLANDELPSYCRSVVDILLLKTKSNLGAIYFLDEKTAMFQPYFSCGFTSEKLKSFAADTNEGEFGAVLIGKKLVRVTSIPDDSFFLYSTIAGTIKPREIISIPVVRNNAVIAIVSLASLDAYNAESLEIIRQSEKNLNMSINAILAFERVKEYTKTVENQNERLSSQAKELKLQTGELVEQNTELEIQKQQIDEANRLKSQFLSSMSHELRTPLNSVIALSGVLYKQLKNQISDEEYSYLEIIGRNGRNLLNLINDILDLSRIEAGKTELQYSTFSLPEMVQQILNSLQTPIRDKNLVLTTTTDQEMPLITSDEDKYHHILQNIIANAVKFTDTGSIEIHLQFLGAEVSVKIKDTGIGIPGDQLPFIFDEFRQVDGTTSRQYGGTGLGLAIADKFVKKLNGRIEVESEPGKGSTFTVILPVDIPGDNAMRPHPEILSTRYHADNEETDVTEFEASQKTILIVEDSEPAIVQLSWILKEQGYQVEIARDGLDALAFVQTKIPDAIILDLMMPGMDGFEVLEKVRGTLECSTIPVLILTAMFLTPSDLKRLSANNVHQLIQKGDVNKKELLSIVKRMVLPKKKIQPDEISKKVIPAKIQGPARILIIDDNADNGTTLKVLLQDKHIIFTAKDGLEGIAMAKKQQPDIILLDISLPGIDGYRVFDEMRKNETLKNIPIIAVTARAMKGDREQILAYGFDDYISKPVDHSILEETISKWIL